MEFRFEQLVSVPRETLFQFYENPAHLNNLHADLPEFRLLHHEKSIRPGATVWVEQTIAGCIPMVMGFRHIIYEPPSLFGEEMIHGPFSLFNHMHEFEDVGEKTLVRDILHITLAWPYGGEIGTRLFAAASIRSLFAFRNCTLQRMADSGELSALTAADQRAGN
ncbi:MAG: hypothetical protein K0U86_06755 [Planctomycetes bacterium]|nr:hypothetical protein [Planctomycetota bacterium]MCH9724588.1 hypothetical protein [Planctomycetota bacterium]MCH9777877.1 hypothetical protein [Planctomycetota bacterium]MCH9793051.1 hypothetical protein [Planctomycetota bacterium]